MAIFSKVFYARLNSRQKENFNFQKVSGVLADYGFSTIRLSDDWQGADFLAYHVNGSHFLKVQLKGVLTVDTKYKGKDIWICFPDKTRQQWYLFPHDVFLDWRLFDPSNKKNNIGATKGWGGPANWGAVATGAYSWPSLSKKDKKWLQPYVIS